MNKRIARTVIILVAFMALIVGLAFNRIVNPATMTREQLNENGLFVYEVPRRFADFSLVDQHQQPFTKADLEGKWTLIFFGYTFCPDICPTTMATLSQFTQLLESETEFAPDTQVVMVSVDPQRDTPEDLAQYVSYFNPDYRGVTGEYIEIFNLAKNLNIAFGYVPAENSEYLVSHSGEIALLNPYGHFHGFFKMPHEPQKMLRNYEEVRKSFR